MFRLTAVALVLMCGTAQAQMCFLGEKYDHGKTLGERFNEAPIWKGTTKSGQTTYELWVNEEKNTWTIIGIDTVIQKGKEVKRTCFMSAGQSYEFPAPPPKGKPT